MLLRKLFLFVLGAAEGVLSLCLALLILPILSVLCVANMALRGIVSLRLRCHATRRLRLSTNGLDNIWGYEAKGNSRNVLNVVVYEEKIDALRYRRLFQEKVLGRRTAKGEELYRRLKERFVSFSGFYCWEEDPHFHINNHIIVLEDDVMEEEGLMELLQSLSEDMSELHPQWQEVIVPSFRDESTGHAKIRSVRILRFHHAFGDAGSWLLLYSHCMAEGDIPYCVNPLKGYPILWWKELIYYTSAIIFAATTMIRNIWFGMHVRSNRLVTPIYSGRRFFAWTRPLDLDLLKDVKQRTQTSIPSVITSAIAASLQRFDAAFPCSRPVGEWTDCGAVAAILPYPNLQLRNRFTVANLSLPTGKGLSRMSRLRTTHAACVALARSAEPMLNFWTFSFFGLFPIPIQKFLMQSAGTSFVFSNLPGASHTFSLLGDKIQSSGAWVPLLTCAGFTVSAAGYRNGVRFCGSTDEASMSKSQLHFLLKTILEEMKGLHEETCGSV